MIENAKPVWLNNVTKNQYVEARQAFAADTTEGTYLQICADAEYAVFINGKFVGAGQYRTFPGKKVYDEYDISDFVKKGENILTVTAYHQGKNTLTYCCSEAAISFAVCCGDTVALSGENTEVRLHPYYESGEIELITNQLGYAFHYDASREETRWQKATVLADYKPEYAKRPIKRLVYEAVVCGEIKTQGVLMRGGGTTPAEEMQRAFLSRREYGEIFSGNTVKKQESGAYFIIDLGCEYAGLFTMTLLAPKGTVIDIGYGEHLDDLRVRTSVGERNFACRYISGGGREEFCSYFRRFACRYLQIHITAMAGDVEFSEIGIIPTVYPLKREAEFCCNDYLFEKIYEVSLSTLKLCMHEHYEDCPWREQALYAYDSYVQMLCGYYAFGEYEFARASLKLLAQSQRPNGILELAAPARAEITIPSFSLAWIVSLEKYVLFSGDVEFGRDVLSCAEKILDYFAIEDGLVKNCCSEELWHFYEWSEGLDGTSFKDCDLDAPINFYYIIATEAYNKICEYIGCSSYRADLEYMRKRVHETFYDSKKGLYKTRLSGELWHELTQALAAISKVAADDKILDKLIAKDNGLVKTTLSTSIFKYEALLEKGTKYIDQVTDELAHIWGKMLFSGADTLWETSEGASAFDNAGSLCHAWSAVPVYLLYKYYIGFKPDLPGFESYFVNPTAAQRLNGFEAELLMPDIKKKIKIRDGKIIS
ncbi:MAG: family 78 glycoside hydrolase catalytic domain [Clostridia bacterium]|nr:family 78 glycoside hydrolase catalytic domain [Clostridia bacterium]